MNKGKKKEQAITLIALVVTIVVLLILAGVSISMLTGENGIVTQAKEAKDNNERGRVIEDVKLAYNKVTIDKLGVQDVETMRDLTIIELKEQGYEIKDITTTTETITEININPETLTLNAGEEEGILTIEYQEENTSDSKYYIKVGKEYYELTINPGDIELATEPTDVESLETEVKENVEITSSDTAETIISIETVGNTITVTPVGAGTATITVTNGSITKQCTVTVEDNNPTAITIKGNDNVAIRDTISLTAEFDKGTGEIEWTSSNPEVATVDSNGVVTGVKSSEIYEERKVTITATYVNNKTIKATKEITVEPLNCDGFTNGDTNVVCENGMISGWVCPNCSSLNFSEPILSGWDYEYCSLCNKDYYSGMTCYEDHPEAIEWRTLNLWSMADCGCTNVMKNPVMGSEDCPVCVNGYIYEY